MLFILIPNKGDAAIQCMQDTPHLTIELVWEDTDLEQLSISASNGQFSGIATAYFAQGDVRLLADSIRGFPRTSSQLETFASGDEYEYPYVKLVFRCADGTGHPVVDVTLADELFHHGRQSRKHRVELDLHFEPLALDEFCRELDLVARRNTKRAVLRGLAA
jgi:hypothetical protein